MSSVSSNKFPEGTIHVESVCKKFKKQTLNRGAYTTLKSVLLSKLFHRESAQAEYIQALSNVSLHVKPGCALGVIGSNGSGKSSLLKLISGIYRPDSGRVDVVGRVSALIELGAGFHPDFTGRENVYLGGVMYGLTRKEIDAKFDSIVKYAELENFIDQPVRTYSSGMYMRLGFSLAVHTEPDILLVDEVLAVGDAAFVHKCKETIEEFKRKGRTLLFVTHDLDSVARWCDEAVWLEKGLVKVQGEPRFVIDSYLAEVSGREALGLEAENADSAGQQADPSERWGSRALELSRVQMFKQGESSPSWLFSSEDQVVCEVEYELKQSLEDVVFGVGILRADGLVVHGSNTDLDEVKLPAMPQGRKGVYRYTIERLGLLDGTYFLDVAAHNSEGLAYDYHHLRYKFSVRNRKAYHGVFLPAHSWSVE